MFTDKPAWEIPSTLAPSKPTSSRVHDDQSLGISSASLIERFADSGITRGLSLLVYNVEKQWGICARQSNRPCYVYARTAIRCLVDG